MPLEQPLLLVPRPVVPRCWRAPVGLERPAWETRPETLPLPTPHSEPKVLPTLSLKERPTPYPAGQCALRLPGPTTSSARVEEEADWCKWACVWSSLLEPLLKSSLLFAKLDKEALPSLRQVLRTRAASTLRRHLPGWRIWVEFTSCEALEPNNPELATLVACFRGLSESGRSATACVSSMRLVAAQKKRLC